MRVYIVDDDLLVLKTFARMLDVEGIETTGFDNAAAFLGALDDLDFGCTMLDINMPGTSGLELLDEVLRRRPPWPVVMVSGSTRVDDAITSFRRGAIHFLRKPFGCEELVATLREAWSIGADRKAAYERRALAQQIRLTPREREVLEGMAEGAQSKVIAWRLGLSIRTVDMHRANILAKLSARNASQAVAIARELDLLARPRSAA